MYLFIIRLLKSKIRIGEYFDKVSFGYSITRIGSIRICISEIKLFLRLVPEVIRIQDSG